MKVVTRVAASVPRLVATEGVALRSHLTTRVWPPSLRTALARPEAYRVRAATPESGSALHRGSSCSRPRGHESRRSPEVNSPRRELSRAMTTGLHVTAVLGCSRRANSLSISLALTLAVAACSTHRLDHPLHTFTASCRGGFRLLHDIGGPNISNHNWHDAIVRCTYHFSLAHS